MSDEYRVLSATFLRSVPDLKDLAPSDMPEVAFLGRSNVGKSSLLNALCSVRSLARTSKLPGRTQALNFFETIYRASKQDKAICHFVDLPGFGYARVPKDMQKKWVKLLESYLFRRPNLSLVVLLADCRRELGEEERRIVELGREGNLVLVLTKVDKLSRSELLKREKEMRAAIGFEAEYLVRTSVVRGKKEGIDELRDVILRKCEV